MGHWAGHFLLEGQEPLLIGLGALWVSGIPGEKGELVRTTPTLRHLAGMSLPPHLSVATLCVCTKSLQSCLSLCDPVDNSPPGSSVHGILQARMLEWVAMPCSKGSSRCRDRTCLSYVSCIGRWVLYP